MSSTSIARFGAHITGIDFSRAHHERRHQPLLADAFKSMAIDQWKAPLFESEHYRVAPRSNPERADAVGHTDRLCRGSSNLCDHLIERQAQLQEFTRSGRQIVDGAVDVINMQVARDRLRLDILREGLLCDCPAKAAGAMTDVEDHAAIDSGAD